VNVSDFILMLIAAAEGPAIIALQSGLDAVYNGIEEKVKQSDNPVDDKVLEVFAKAITTWEPKNSG